ncbi:MAG TPA: iron uptake transporter deferrochelatase/peroxidase subunit [Chloroflexota bacterium]|nr:iron uptake transporter deferrochelatase/peroxidase subunit [Chloroflexota bacterium]
MVDESGSGGRPTRRAFLTMSGMTVLGAALATDPTARAAASSGLDASIPFYGDHQAGIATEAQNYLCFAAFDLAAQTALDIAHLLRMWSQAAALMSAGQQVRGTNTVQADAPEDTGEAFGLPAANLTVTFGFGPSMFQIDGQDRFGLMSRQPEALRALPAFPGDALDPSISDGDVCIQACADDPQIAFHAVHNLWRLALGAVSMRWMQMGFGRTATTSSRQASARNLMGFKDGTDNIRGDDAAAMKRFVWSGSEAPAWMQGGTYVVCRRILIFLEPWDLSSLHDQEATFGRRKASGAPLSGRKEYDPPDLKAIGADGKPVIPTDAHIRLASPSYNRGERILRRGYSFNDVSGSGTRAPNSGLFFICFQRNPRAQFARIQSRLALSDHLSQFVEHTGSALFAVPPGAAVGSFVGASLLS